VNAEALSRDALMTDTAVEMNGRAKGAAQQDRPDTSARRVAELEAEVAALRRALARAGLDAGRVAERHRGELAEERVGRAGDAVEARTMAAEVEARHGRETAADRADLAAERADNAVLGRANAALAESRAALREREERLRLVLDSAIDYAIFTTDLDRRVTSWNAGAERLLGWAEGEIVGRSGDLIFTPEDRQAGAPVAEAARARAEGRAENERWHQRRDGSRFRACGLSMSLRDPAAGPDAPPLGLLKIMRDRTEQRRAEEALRARERRLRLLADMAAGLLAATDPDEVLGPVFRSLSQEFGLDISFSYVVDGERGGLRLASCFGVPEESRAGLDRLAIGEGVCGAAARERRPVHVADIQGSGDPRAAFVRGLGVRVCAAFPLLAGDDRLLGTLSFGSRGRDRFSEEELAFLGTIAQHVAVVRERLRAEAALRDAERRLRATQDHAGVGIHEVDAEGRYVRVSATFTRMTGYTLADLAGRSLWDLIEDEEDRRAARAAFGRLVRGEIDSATEQRAYTNKHGRRWWAEITTTAVRNEGGRFLWAVRVLHDITDSKRAEERRGAMVELGDRLRSLRDTAAIAGTAAEIIGRTLGAARAGYGTVDAAQEVFRVERDWTDGRVAGIAREHRLSEYREDFALRYGKGAPVAIGDVERAPRTAASAAAYATAGVRALLDVPVVADGRVAAVLYVHDVAPRAWTAEDIAFVRGVAERAWAAAVRARAEAGRALLVKELNHRVKNTLAVVQSLALQTARGAPNLPAFSAAFQARLIALARAHDLLTREDWAGAPLGAVARAALEPMAIDGARLDLSGCASGSVLPPGAALALTMALHELATNALKHGALAAPEGRVRVACRAAAEPGDAAPVVEWVERGGPPVAGPPARRGFGLRLLGRGLAAEAGVGADLRFEPEGVRCTLRLPPSPVGAPATAA
jgi:PAS domain S-box-containing protein